MIIRCLFNFISIFILQYLLLLTHEAKAANLNESYHVDQVYLALKPEAGTFMIKDGQVEMTLFSKAFEPILRSVEIREVSVPFFQAIGSPLESVLQLVVNPETNLIELCKTLNSHSAVAYAERVPVVEFYESYYPNDLTMDSNYTGQWYLHKILAPQAWTISRGSPDIKVAVVDQAVDIHHPDLREVIWTNPGEIPDNGIDDDGNGYVDDVHGYDVAEDDPDPSPDNPQQTHGTHVAGLVSAKSDNNTGIASIGFNLSIIPVKSAYSNNVGAEQFKGVTYAASVGADIISCSWGARGFSITQKNVIEYAQQQGALVVCSSGNDGKDTLGYPAAYPGVVTVGATTILDRTANFSNYNEKLSVSAPGQNIISTLPNNQYESYSGTSMATPIVSGLLGLMKSHHPQISNEELKTCLLTTTDPVDIHVAQYEGKTGAGRINAYKAMLCVDDLKSNASKIEITTDPNRPFLYPNPSIGKFHLQVDHPGQMRIYNLQGSALLEKYMPAGKQVVDLSRFSKGTYVVELIDLEGRNHYEQKLVIQ